MSVKPISIKQLPVQIANQIAAGEVVERPASVVKELVENSIDAGASRIDIDIEQGGSKLIRIRDNGCGIAGDELALALMRHATSKISSLDDLQVIDSLGFRGEALASISSVSRLLLTSCQQGQQQAWQAYAEGRDMQVTVKPAAHPQGTTLEVRDLFYNTPARRKFLRTEKTEFMHIDEVIRRIALARFDISFMLSHNGKLLRQYRVLRENYRSEHRLEAVCGSGVMRQLLAIDWQHGDLALRGWLSLSASEEMQYSYVNGRVMRDRLINHAIRQAVEQSGVERASVGWVLFLTVSPDQLDVNVHPAKQEVRFHQSRLVHDFVCQGLTCVLNDALPVENRAAAGKNSFQSVGGGGLKGDLQQGDLQQDGLQQGGLQNNSLQENKPQYMATPVDIGNAAAVANLVDNTAVCDEKPVTGSDRKAVNTTPPGDSDSREKSYRYAEYGRSGNGYQRQEAGLYKQLVTPQPCESLPSGSGKSASSTPPPGSIVSEYQSIEQQGFGRVLAIVQSTFALLERHSRIQLLSLTAASQLLAEQTLCGTLPDHLSADIDSTVTQPQTVNQQTRHQDSPHSQPLLIPLRLPVSAKERKYLSRAQSGLAALGVVFTLEGGYLLINSLPLLLRQQNLHILIPKLTDYLVECGELKCGEFDPSATARWLAKHVSDGQQHWTIARVITLLTQLERCCPSLLVSPPGYLLCDVDCQSAIKSLQNV